MSARFVEKTIEKGAALNAAAPSKPVASALPLTLDFELRNFSPNEVSHVTLPPGGSEARRRGGLYF